MLGLSAMIATMAAIGVYKGLRSDMMRTATNSSSGLTLSLLQWLAISAVFGLVIFKTPPDVLDAALPIVFWLCGGCAVGAVAALLNLDSRGGIRADQPMSQAALFRTFTIACLLAAVVCYLPFDVLSGNEQMLLSGVLLGFGLSVSALFVVREVRALPVFRRA